MADARLQYPLEQVLEIKKKRVADAERKLKEKIEALEKEKQILIQKEKARDKVLQHRNDKLAQLRQEMDQAGTTTSAKIQQMKDYLKVVAERLKEEEKKVAEQKKVVQQAEEQVAQAREELRLKQLEVDKLVQHRTDWIQLMKIEIEQEEDRVLDEIGEVIHQMHKRKNK